MKIVRVAALCVLATGLNRIGTASDDTPPTKVPSIWTSSKFSYSPANGCVPDAKTAFKIAYAILLPIYGQKEIDYNKPFVAVLRKGIWTVGGTGYHPGIEGGGMEIDISKSDGRILRIYAGQ